MNERRGSSPPGQARRLAPVISSDRCKKPGDLLRLCPSLPSPTAVHSTVDSWPLLRYESQHPLSSCAWHAAAVIRPEALVILPRGPSMRLRLKRRTWLRRLGRAPLLALALSGCLGRWVDVPVEALRQQVLPPRIECSSVAAPPSPGETRETLPSPQSADPVVFTLCPLRPGRASRRSAFARAANLAARSSLPLRSIPGCS